MSGFKIDLDDEELLKVIDSKLDEITDNVFANSQENIVQKGIVDEGTLLKSGNITREFLEKTITYGASHSDVIEFGRLPGTMPPLEPIKAWVRRKGIARDEKSIKRIAWAIIQDIKKEGQIPRPFLSPAIETEKNNLRAR